MSRFLEKYKVDMIKFDSSGQTLATASKSGYYDMMGYKRADFFIAGQVYPTIVGNTAVDAGITAQVYLATDCSGGGAQNLSTATAVIMKSSAALSATNYVSEIIIGWNTGFYDDAAGGGTALTITIGTAAFVTSSAASVAMAYVTHGSSDAATVASEGFKACFNSTVLNTSTVLTANWKCVDMNASATKAADPYVKIVRKNPDATCVLNFSQDGTNTHIQMGYSYNIHVGVPVEMMGDHRFIGIGVTSSDVPSPYAVTLVRERTGQEVRKLEAATVVYDNGIQKSIELTLSTAKGTVPA